MRFLPPSRPPDCRRSNRQDNLADILQMGSRRRISNGSLPSAGGVATKDPRKTYVWLDIATRNGDAQPRPERDRVLATLTPDDASRAAASAADTLRLPPADAADLCRR
jgi:hypothetical protein